MRGRRICATGRSLVRATVDQRTTLTQQSFTSS